MLIRSSILLISILALFCTASAQNICEGLLKSKSVVIASKADRHLLLKFVDQKISIRIGYSPLNYISAEEQSLFEHRLPGEGNHLTDELKGLPASGPYWLGTTSVYVSRFSYLGQLRNYKGQFFFESSNGMSMSILDMYGSGVIDYLIIDLI